jgi:hypothetical protein
MTRLANVKKVAGVTAMAAVLTAAGWGVGSATKQRPTPIRIRA